MHSLKEMHEKDKSFKDILKKVSLLNGMLIDKESLLQGYINKNSSLNKDNENKICEEVWGRKRIK